MTDIVSEIVIRCPNCGTVQSALGECEACHEADTRYFCTNHDPGRWLDGPACRACGARYGVKSPSTRPATRVRREPPASWRPSPPPVDEPEPVPVFEIEPAAFELPARRVEPPVPIDGLTLAATASGCVRRAIVLFLVLLALAALAVFGLLGGGIRLL